MEYHIFLLGFFKRTKNGKDEIIVHSIVQSSGYATVLLCFVCFNILHTTYTRAHLVLQVKRSVVIVVVLTTTIIIWYT